MRLMITTQVLGALVVLVTAYGTEPPTIGGTSAQPAAYCCNLLLEGPVRARIAAVR